MSTRLQVVMSEAEHEEIRAAADRRRMTVSEWVRVILRDGRARELRGAAATVREVAPGYPGPGSGIGRRVRFELDLREALIEAVRQRYHLPNPQAAIEFALRRVAVRPMSKDEALAMEGVGWDGDLESMRSGDPGAPW